MSVNVGDVVKSIAGRDKEKLFLVCNVEDGYVFLANGKERKTTKAKRKKIKHIKLIIKAKNIELAKKIASKEPVSNERLAKELAKIKQEDCVSVKETNHICGGILKDKFLKAIDLDESNLRRKV